MSSATAVTMCSLERDLLFVRLGGLEGDILIERDLLIEGEHILVRLRGLERDLLLERELLLERIFLNSGVRRLRLRRLGTRLRGRRLGFRDCVGVT